MIIAYINEIKIAPEIITLDNISRIQNALWIDLLNPTKEEEFAIKSIFNLDIPTREKMQEIELSSRLYKLDDALVMTVIMVAKSESPEPVTDSVTVILLNGRLITVRYIEPHSFALFISYFTNLPFEARNNISLLIELLDASIDRLADILEMLSNQLDYYSHVIFHSHTEPNSADKTDYKMLLQKIGSGGDLNTKIQESLISFNRLITFFRKNFASKLDPTIESKLAMITKDSTSLNDHVAFLSSKVNFLLDATLGMINIEQNNIIKIFSIVAVILLPPTLVASIYGMNFAVIPELQWRYGYPCAILLMLFSAWMPYKYFKRKHWL